MVYEAHVTGSPPHKPGHRTPKTARPLSPPTAPATPQTPLQQAILAPQATTPTTPLRLTVQGRHDLHTYLRPLSDSPSLALAKHFNLCDERRQPGADTFADVDNLLAEHKVREGGKEAPCALVRLFQPGRIIRRSPAAAGARVQSAGPFGRGIGAPRHTLGPVEPEALLEVSVSVGAMQWRRGRRKIPVDKNLCSTSTHRPGSNQVAGMPGPARGCQAARPRGPSASSPGLPLGRLDAVLPSDPSRTTRAYDKVCG